MQSLKELYKIGNGPSSSHTMGPKRCAEYALNKYGSNYKYEVILYASLALTGKGHLTDYIIKTVLPDCTIKFDIYTEVKHPNTLDIIIYDNSNNKVDEIRFYSVGGGTISIEGIDDIAKEDVYPEKNFEEIKAFCLKNNIGLHEYAYHYEPEIKEYLEVVYEKMVECIKSGLNKEGYLPGSLKVERRAKALYNAKLDYETREIYQSRIVSSFAFAVSEENASGGEIVTAPTCGASGVVPSVMYYLKHNHHFTKEKLIDGLAVAGVIGNVVKHNASISGAECGCQAEVGTATSMAAALHAFMFNYSIEQIEYASEVALEHQLGLTCDPIRGYVQIPCIERNAVAATRAIESSRIACFLTGSRKISFDYVVKTMKETGKDLHHHYRETSLGGLAKDYNGEEYDK